jgi:tetratricopeptide (TPR) repeat protein
LVAAEAAAAGWAELRGAALVGLGSVLQKQGRGEEARFALIDAQAIAEETGDTKLEVQTLFELSELKRDFSGEPEAAVVDLERAVELAAVLDDRHLLAEGELRRGFVLVADGRLALAEQALARSAEIGSELGSRRDESRATCQHAYIAYHRGRPEEAERRALEAQEWFERTGDSYFRVQNLRSLSTFALARDDGAEAERRLREAILLANPTGGWLVSELNADLAELLVALGRVDEAEAALAVATDELPEGDPAARAVVCVAAACVAGARDDRNATRRFAEEALEIVVDLGNRLEVTRVRIALARPLAKVGEKEQAAELLRLAGESASEIGATMLLADAETTLSELESGKGRSIGS